ncbi:MAG TPA: RDD family protein [Stellaceae bacterium]|nr:RDD family protein [Stellaceae bacterium]
MTDTTTATTAPARPAAAPAYHYAPFARRGAAFVLDWAIVTGALFAVVYGVGIAFVLHRPDHAKAMEAYIDVVSFLVQALWVLLIWLYCAVLEGGPHEETIGQLAFGMKVIDYSGKPIGYFRASLRILLKILFCLPLLITDDIKEIADFPLGAMLLVASLPFAFDCAFALFTPRKQALHDLIVRCLVVKKHA